jgi:D-alanyl-D-alanine carboxypeptidase
MSCKFRGAWLAALFWCAGGCVTNRPYVPPLRAQDPDSVEGRLQHVLDEAVNAYGLPGAQAGVQLPDGRRIVVSSGTRDLGRRQLAIESGDVFKIGSATKMFVAALIGRLQERGLLSFDDAVDRWLPELPDAQQISLRQLLAHRSGIPEKLFSKFSIVLKTAFSDHVRWDPRDVIRRVVTATSAEDRQKASFHYANANYLILGLIAERAGGAPIRAQLAREFFDPLGMKHTFLLPGEPTNPPALISGYDEYMPLGPHLIAPDCTSWDSLAFTAGAMASTADDLLRWLDALFHGRVVTSETLKELELFRDSRNNGRDESMVAYGLGLAVYEIDGRRALGHPGGGMGGECFPFYVPEHDASLVVLYNVSRKGNPAGKRVLARVLHEVVEREAQTLREH